MKFIKITFFLIFTLPLSAQIDYSDSWEDFYSYNNVKDFYFSNNKIYAVCDNAVFIYNKNNNTYKKISSVHGLSGETASSFYYSTLTQRLIIGYENGLIEVVNQDGSIQASSDIVRLNVTGSKRINQIIEYNTKLYLATDFAVIEYDVDHLVFGDTFYIGNQSSIETINQLAIYNNFIYAATAHGVYIADVTNANLIDFNNWQQPQGELLGDFKATTVFNNELFVAKNKNLYKIINQDELQLFQTFATNIVNLKSSVDFLNVSLQKYAYTYNQQLIQVDFSEANNEVDFILNSSFSENSITYLATQKFGILKKTFNQFDYEEIHPEGPLFNDVYSIDVYNNNLWVVYGAQDFYTFNPISIKKGFSHYNGENWVNTAFYSGLPMDLVDVTIDPNHANRTFISSWHQGGLLEIVNDEVINNFNYLNSGLERRDVTWANNTYVSSCAFDSRGDLWVTNGYVADKIKKFDRSGSWQGYDFTEVLLNNYDGLGDVYIDKNDTKWIETRFNGVLAINKDGTKVKALNENLGIGNLPNNKVKSMAIDQSNRVWIGTPKGLVRFDNAASIFNLETYNARPIIIKLDGGTDENQGQILLGEQNITAIAVDGADNKWFGTESGGVLGTNPNGQKTLHIFNKDNSPLPSNFINKIKVDNTTGKVYFATTKGLVVFNNKVAPFGDHLEETYAYPNPSTKENDIITIDGRYGTHLPKGTNVKILDSAGYLVYETNVLEGIELKGGKVSWNKRNLAGRKVASGVYIIMLSLPDKSETSICKVAIIN